MHSSKSTDPIFRGPMFVLMSKVRLLKHPFCSGIPFVNLVSMCKDQVWLTLYGHGLGEFPLPKFKVGDTVRISRYKSHFDKGYEANFTEEKFRVTKVFRGDPNMYEIQDSEAEPIIGKLYEEEMSPVSEDPHVYKIEKILRKRKGKVLVKWLGYDTKHNSWIPERDIINK